MVTKLYEDRKSEIRHLSNNKFLDSLSANESLYTGIEEYISTIWGKTGDTLWATFQYLQYQACSSQVMRRVMLLLPSLPRNVVSLCGDFRKIGLMGNRFTSKFKQETPRMFCIMIALLHALSVQPSKTMTFLCFVFSTVLYFFKKTNACSS